MGCIVESELKGKISKKVRDGNGKFHYIEKNIPIAKDSATELMCYECNVEIESDAYSYPQWFIDQTDYIIEQEQSSYSNFTHRNSLYNYHNQSGLFKDTYVHTDLHSSSGYTLDECRAFLGKWSTGNHSWHESLSKAIAQATLGISKISNRYHNYL